MVCPNDECETTIALLRSENAVLRSRVDVLEGLIAFKDARAEKLWGVVMMILKVVAAACFHAEGSKGEPSEHGHNVGSKFLPWHTGTETEGRCGPPSRIDALSMSLTKRR